MNADHKKLGRGFYARPAVTCAPEFLGKVLVHETSLGRISGIVTDVEAYPAFVDEVHHGNKRTPRAEVMWGPAGHSYVYVIYGKWNQFACVVAKPDVPDVVFIRAVWPIEGIEIVTAQWEGAVEPHKVTDSPGKLCKSLQISRDHYGIDLCGGDLFIEDWGIQISPMKVKMAKRVGISSKHQGHDSECRYYISRRDIANMEIASDDTPPGKDGGIRGH